MKFKISKSQWTEMGKKAGWIKKSNLDPVTKAKEMKFDQTCHAKFGQPGTKLTQEQMNQMKQLSDQMGLDWLDVGPVMNPDGTGTME